MGTKTRKARVGSKRPKAPEGLYEFLEYYRRRANAGLAKFKGLEPAQQTGFSKGMASYWKNVASGIRWIQQESHMAAHKGKAKKV